jgi:pSer/pThr/pTyr-binding forkhead associated (FHA) protein
VEPRAVLILEDGGEGASGRWPLAETTTIGRAPDCDIVFTDREVSRHHARVVRKDERHVLADLGSKNGTLVNGARIEGATPLRDGDEITIPPRVRLRFVDLDATVSVVVRSRGLALDLESRDVRVDGELLRPPLSPAQFALLALLSEHRGRVYSREEIAERCYPDAPGGVSDLAIEGIVRRVRARLAELDPSVEHVVAVRGHGYRLGG